MKAASPFRLLATASLGISFSTACPAQFLDGVQSITVSAPVSATHAEAVAICYGNVGRKTVCDYLQPPLTEMTVPYWGQIVYTGRIVPNAESRAFFSAANPQNECALRLDGTTFLSNTRIMGNGDILSWDLSEVALGDGSDCFGNGDPMRVFADITVTVERPDGEQVLVTVTMTNLKDWTPGANSYQMQPIVIRTRGPAPATD